MAGLFGPDSEAWRLDREAFLLLGAGPRALLLQLAHPRVAEGVDRYSDFRADPWRRLDATLRSYLRIVYGSRSAGLAEVRRLNALHRGFSGPGWTARDPDLSLWVHATLIDATIAVADAWAGPLPRARAARFYAETLPLGLAFGVPAERLPVDLDAFEAYVAAMLGPDGPVHPGPTARALVRHILHPPLGPLHPALGRLPGRAYDWLLWPSVGLLPETVRDGYGIAWTPLQRAIAAWLVAGWRAWNPWLPTGWRRMPQALAAERRVRGARR